MTSSSSGLGRSFHVKVHNLLLLLHLLILRNLGNLTYDETYKKPQLASPEIIALTAGAGLAVLEKITHALVWPPACMAVEQIAFRIAVGNTNAVELGGQTVDVLHVDFGWASTGFQMIEERRHSRKILFTAGAIDVTGPMLGRVLEGMRRKVNNKLLISQFRDRRVILTEK